MPLSCSVFFEPRAYIHNPLHHSIHTGPRSLPRFCSTTWSSPVKAFNPFLTFFNCEQSPDRDQSDHAHLLRDKTSNFTNELSILKLWVESSDGSKLTFSGRCERYQSFRQNLSPKSTVMVSIFKTEIWTSMVGHGVSVCLPFLLLMPPPDFYPPWGPAAISTG